MTENNAPTHTTPAPPSRGPFGPGLAIASHRGFGKNVDGWPENSLPAFREAVRYGVPWLEVDVRRTRDGALFVHHWPSVGVDDGRFVSDLTGDEARKAGLLALDDLLEVVPKHVGVIYDVKTAMEDALLPPSRDTTALLLPVLDAERDRPQLVTSFDPASLLFVGQEMPGVARGLITWISFPMRKAVPAAARLGVEVLSAHWKSFGPNGTDSAPHHRPAEYAIDIAHRAGVQVLAWSPAMGPAAELAAAGVDALVVDDVPGGLALARGLDR
ncbi:glycerophosphodiester phosphodiesterase [Kineosporia sp. J2-2]|uniref:Glycerophosphodiester phosphodiesterase n=1 Tax=Kineosporia corallincola TaxID=2835133 RepID=A0ABS5TJB5_9ACTN|nr:glycerophosphodiester phosphodiesterase [Kineosporia corallincola]MBT0770489.1 glycerophosphodiester phosphodiesterase [Kineosporia corallincola]